MARFVFQSLVKWLSDCLKDYDFWLKNCLVKSRPTPEQLEKKDVYWKLFFSLRDDYKQLLSYGTEVNNG